MISEHQLLAKWINRLLIDHFKEQKKIYTDKLFIKISGLSSTDIEYILREFNNTRFNGNDLYSPVIRTISPMEGFEEFSYRDNETSTWLRNNTKVGHALILLINEITPEAQSLENLFTIDESYLLTDFGLEALYNILSEQQVISAEEIHVVNRFIHMYKSISEPQLRNITKFFAGIIQGGHVSIIDSIQHNMPAMNLFVDSKLVIEMSQLNRLKGNYELANLLIKDKDIEKIINNFYVFLETEKANGYLNEVWQSKTEDELSAEIHNFINKISNDFLKNEYDFALNILNYKVRKSNTLITQIQGIYQNYKNQLDEPEKLDFKAGIDELANPTDPDALQTFKENFHELLQTEKGVFKKLDRLIEKLRNPSSYTDIKEALLREIYLLLEDAQTNSQNLDRVIFNLEVVSGSVDRRLLNLYLKNIQNLIPIIRFKDYAGEDEIKDKEVVFKISLSNDDVVLGEHKFKITSFGALEVTSFFEYIDQNIIPHQINYAGSEIDIEDIRLMTEGKVKHYITSDESYIKEEYKNFVDFLNYYLECLKIIMKEGIFSIDHKELETRLEGLTEGIYKTTLISKHLLYHLNLVGAIDYYDNGKNQLGITSLRKLTLFNPIRLLAYIKRFETLGATFSEWIQLTRMGLLNPEKPEEYLEFISSQTSKLAPVYFTSNGDNSFLIENNEIMGEGAFSLSTKQSTDDESLSVTLTQELAKTLKNYLEVYPYAADGIDILMMYCQEYEIITKCIDAIFAKTKIKKLRLTVHSGNAAHIHSQLNKWLEQKEEYNKPELGSKFPKLEINVINGRDIRGIFEQVDTKMKDCDLVVLADFFSQNEQIQFKFSRVPANRSDDWFKTVYKEPLSDDETIKKMNFVSEYLPITLQNFYQMQYIIQEGEMPAKDEINVLKTLISLNNISHSVLINEMHTKFNWVLILDRYLDKTLLRKTSHQANIIQYKPKNKKQNLNVIVSSSEYIKKLSDNTQNYAYYDRFYRKLEAILKNDTIDRNVVIHAINTIKELSGSLVLKVLGRGKFAHEMIATYLTVDRKGQSHQDKLLIWSSCDDLPWFANNKRRPDLVLTSIYKSEGKINVDFEIIELKFVNESIFDKERIDALKQIKIGMDTYEELFDFTNNNIDGAFWKSELISYFIESNAYIPEHVSLLKDLQQIAPDKIQVSIKGSADVYCYTSNLVNYNFEKMEEGIYLDHLDTQVDNFIFNRAYILKKLKAQEEQPPVYENEELDTSIQNSIQRALENENVQLKKEKTTCSNEKIQDESLGSASEDSSTKVNVNSDTIQPETPENKEQPEHAINHSNYSNDASVVTIGKEYPEVRALEDIELDYPIDTSKNEELKNTYIKKLKLGLNQNGMNAEIKGSIVGSSVIRIILKLPQGLGVQKLMAKAQDMQLWLEIDEQPHIFINKDGINIDIIRDEPETIYFEKFMALTREQLQDKIKPVNLIAPLGLDPLNNVMYMDFSSSLSPHLLTGGTTGSGKSVTLNSIILGIMCLYTPKEVQMIFIDPKKVEFTMYEEKVHTREVITEIEEAVDALEKLVDEMEYRYRLFAKEGVTNLEEYITEVGEEQLPRIMVVFDEFADFMSQEGDVKKRVETSILRLAQKARAAGIHLIICTQNPKSDIINTNIRNNLPARLALKAADSNASNIILGEAGAERLAGKGDYLAKVSGNTERGKSPFLTPKVRRALLKYFARP